MRKYVVGLLVFACILAGGLYYWMGLQEDTDAPVISFPEGSVLYEENEDTSVLLEGVTAIDEVDGDVSDTLVVESIIPSSDETSATVIYYARDTKNNVGRASREVEYRPEEGILWILETEEETEPETKKIEETEEEYSGLSTVYPRITLTTHTVTIQNGESYNLLSYVASVSDDVDEESYLYTQIHIEGMYEISGPGVYELYYTVADREGNFSDPAKLTLTIE
ncbi:MAG: DUF5011 domain-containing protein [Lachnospiraceae bacterium]|nr:DUF5011 domain-containing protein [Lachnospiraceae bacterium]